MRKLQCINHIGETTSEVLDKTFLSPSFFFFVNIYLFPYATLQLRYDLLQPVPPYYQVKNKPSDTAFFLPQLLSKQCNNPSHKLKSLLTAAIKQLN